MRAKNMSINFIQFLSLFLYSETRVKLNFIFFIISCLLAIVALVPLRTAFAQISLTEQNSLIGGSFYFGDYDNNGYVDIVSGNIDYRDYQVYPKIYHNDKNNFYYSALDDQYSDFPLATGGANVSWVDYNNDGWLDVYMTWRESTARNASFFRNNKDGTFSKQPAYIPGSPYGNFAWKDFDNDGLSDLLICGIATESGYEPITRIYRNNGSGNFTDIAAGLIGVQDCSLAWVDYDNDGYQDVFITGSHAEGSQLYRNNRDASFSKAITTIPSVTMGGAVWGDYNNDDYPDLLITGTTTDSNSISISSIYKNNGNGTFTNIEARLTPLRYSSAAWGDLDGDGFLDIIVNGMDILSNRITKVYRNNKNGGFVNENLTGLPASVSGKILVSDINNDGALDIALTGQNSDGSNSLRLFKNNSKYSISGFIKSDSSPFSGVAIQIMGDAAGTTVSNVDGSYKFIGLSRGNYVIKPIPPSPFEFQPLLRKISLISASISKQDFDARIPTQTIIPPTTGCLGSTIKTMPGICGCNVMDEDLNSNGFADCIDFAFKNILPLPPKLNSQKRALTITLAPFRNATYNFGKDVRYKIKVLFGSSKSKTRTRYYESSTGKMTIKKLSVDSAASVSYQYLIRGNVLSKNSATKRTIIR